MNSLNAVSPIDGRYRSKCEPLAAYYSEGALIRYRVRVEVEYFIALAAQLVESGKWKVESGKRVADKAEALRDLYRHFSDDDAQAIKDIEKVTNHDVKAVEYFLKGKFDEMGLADLKEFIHFGLTSQDINNTSVPLSIKESAHEVLLPAYRHILTLLEEKAEEWKNIPMLAHTHGQPASPTTLGKEWGVFAYRLRRQINELERLPFSAKFGGATGNFNAHLAAFPEVDWRAFGNRFVSEQLGLERQQLTTQIENYDMMAAWFDACKRINVILIDLCRDVWTYVSMEYFKQKIKAGEVGSSAMPHKVNPIDFENAEGNLGLANALFEHLSHKLPVSRMQRDLTDSTVSRNIGVPVAHTMISLASLEKGLGKLLLNEQALYRDLENNWAVVAEAIQTILRSVGYPNPYEALKQLTRTNEKVTAQTIADFVETLEVGPEVKERLKKITPHNYIGYSL
ncbi:MAG: adenylosuccinate lyase [Bacteroidales bacterium]|nr:adenylosuccinate lyase [Bacteroidales bacterium]